MQWPVILLVFCYQTGISYRLFVDYCRLFAKQVEFEDALSTIAKRNEEQSQLQSRIAELERQLSNRDTQINR